MGASIETFLSGLGVTAAQLLDLESLAARGDDATVFISGSLLEGLGNQTSDIDLYVIGDVRPIGSVVISKKDFICISKHEIVGRRVDVEFWSPQDVEALAARLDAVDERHNLDAFECEEIDFIHRLKVARALRGEKTLARWQARFDYPKLVRYMKHQAEINVLDVLEDLEGMIANGDLEVAIIRCHDLLGDLGEYTLRCVGDTNPKRKWVIKLLARYPDSAVAADVRARMWALQFPAVPVAGADAAACLSHINAWMQLARDTLAATSSPAPAGVA